MKRISVIVPVYNRASLVGRCLDSVMAQTCPPDELIVVDNGSTDGSQTVILDWMGENSDKGVDLKFYEEKKKGACHARQKGLENAEGDYVIFFDSDDEMLPELVENVVETVKINPDIDVVTWRCQINQLDGTKKIPAFLPQNPVEGHLIHALLMTVNYAARRELSLNSGGWSKSIKVWDDYELGLRIILQNPKVSGIPKVLAQVYSQEESITGTDFSSKEGEWESTLEEMDLTVDNSNHPQKRRIKRILNYRRAILAAHYSREGNSKGAAGLMKKTLSGLPAKERLPLLFSYHFTRFGLRGVWRIVRYFI